MKRILIVDRPQAFQKNGVGRYLLEIASAVDYLQSDFDVSILHLGHEVSVTQWKDSVLTERPPSKWRLWLNKKYLLSLGLQRSNAALIHYPYGNLHTHWARGKAPRVLTLHGMGKYISLPWYEPWQQKRAAKLQQRFQRDRHNIQQVIAVTQFVKKQAVDYLRLAPDIITVIPNGIDSDRFFLIPNRDDIKRYLYTKLGITMPYLFHLGPGGPRKNVLRQLQAFAQLKEKLHLPHKLVFAGLAGKDRIQQIQRFAAELKISQDVITFGEIRDDECLRMLYNGAEIFLFPSLYEGFGIPVLEAMACGTAVVTSNTNSLPEASGQAAAFVNDPTDVENLAHVIRTVLEDTNYRKNLQQLGLTHIRSYDWEMSAKLHLQLYQRILGDST